MIREPIVPDSHEMNPYTLPTEALLESCRQTTCLWTVRVDGEVAVVGTVAKHE